MPAIIDVPGIKVGHATNREALTGCTVILAGEGAVAGVDVRGSAPGTRETDLLRPGNLVERVNAVLLAGGSAFGLAAADGVMAYLEEKGIGFDVGVARVPIVPAAVLFDLQAGDPRVRPDRAMGYQACVNASATPDAAEPGKPTSKPASTNEAWNEAGPLSEGNVGAGTGATVGKLFGPLQCMKGGLGTWSITLPGGAVIGAIVAVNAFGDVLDSQTGKLLAGPRDPQTGQPVRTMEILQGKTPEAADFADFAGANTTIGVVATNARLSKEAANKVAQMAHDGLARSISPVHTMLDGDTLFALSIGDLEADLSTVGAVAAEAVAVAVKRAILAAEALGGIPPHRDIFR